MLRTDYRPPVLVAVGGPGRDGGPTKGGQVISVEAHQLGPVGGMSVGGASPVLNYGGREVAGDWWMHYEGVRCNVTAASVQAQCFTQAGTGKDHAIRVTIAGQRSNALMREVSYAPPVITQFPQVVEGANGTQLTVSGARDADTRGMQQVVVLGDNFGTGVDGEMGDLELVTYSRPVTSLGGDGEESTDDGTVLPPPVVFTARYCAVTVAHIEITCMTTEGAGEDLRWTVVVDNQTSVQPATDYGVPEIHSVDGPGAREASTDGRQTVYIRGKNFGPVTSLYGRDFLDFVTYGPSGTEYAATECEVLSHISIRCVTAPGVGETLRWIVSVEGQTSLPSDPSAPVGVGGYVGPGAGDIGVPLGGGSVSNNTNAGYAAPSVESVNPDGRVTAEEAAAAGAGSSAQVFLGVEDVPTAGGVPVEIVGRDFGLRDARARVDVVLNGVVLLPDSVLFTDASHRIDSDAAPNRTVMNQFGNFSVDAGAQAMADAGRAVLVTASRASDDARRAAVAAEAEGTPVQDGVIPPGGQLPVPVGYGFPLRSYWVHEEDGADDGPALRSGERFLRRVIMEPIYSSSSDSRVNGNAPNPLGASGQQPDGWRVTETWYRQRHLVRVQLPAGEGGPLDLVVSTGPDDTPRTASSVSGVDRQFSAPAELRYNEPLIEAVRVGKLAGDDTILLLEIEGRDLGLVPRVVLMGEDGSVHDALATGEDDDEAIAADLRSTLRCDPPKDHTMLNCTYQLLERGAATQGRRSGNISIVDRTGRRSPAAQFTDFPAELLPSLRDGLEEQSILYSNGTYVLELRGRFFGARASITVDGARCIPPPDSRTYCSDCALDESLCPSCDNRIGQSGSPTAMPRAYLPQTVETIAPGDDIYTVRCEVPRGFGRSRAVQVLSDTQPGERITVHFREPRLGGVTVPGQGSGTSPVMWSASSTGPGTASSPIVIRTSGTVASGSRRLQTSNDTAGGSSGSGSGSGSSGSGSSGSSEETAVPSLAEVGFLESDPSMPPAPVEGASRTLVTIRGQDFGNWSAIDAQCRSGAFDPASPAAGGQMWAGGCAVSESCEQFVEAPVGGPGGGPVLGCRARCRFPDCVWRADSASPGSVGLPASQSVAAGEPPLGRLALVKQFPGRSSETRNYLRVVSWTDDEVTAELPAGQGTGWRLVLDVGLPQLAQLEDGFSLSAASGFGGPIASSEDSRMGGVGPAAPPASPRFDYMRPRVDSVAVSSPDVGDEAYHGTRSGGSGAGDFAMATYPTESGDRVTLVIDGDGFGRDWASVAAGTEAAEVFMAPVVELCDLGAQPTSARDQPGVAPATMEECLPMQVVMHTDRRLVVRLPEGAGDQKWVRVSVQGQSSTPQDSGARFAYAPPVLQALDRATVPSGVVDRLTPGASPVLVPVNLTLTGRSFGSPEALAHLRRIGSLQSAMLWSELEQQRPSLEAGEQSGLGTQLSLGSGSLTVLDAEEAYAAAAVAVRVDGTDQADEAPRYARVVGHSHTQVVVHSPQGEGLTNRVWITAAGLESPAFMSLSYSAPKVLGVYDERGDPLGDNLGLSPTTGGFRITIRGESLGLQRANEVLVPGQEDDDAVARRELQSVPVADTSPVANARRSRYLYRFRRRVLVAHNEQRQPAVYDPTDSDGGRFPARWKECVEDQPAGLVPSWSHDEITCTMPDGIGTALAIAVFTGYDAPQISNRLLESDGSVINFSYDPPRIDYMSPFPADASGDTVTFYGANFADAAGTILAANLSVLVGGLECSEVRDVSADAAARQARASNGASATTNSGSGPPAGAVAAGRALVCDASRDVVGLKNVSMNVAAQAVQLSVDSDENTEVTGSSFVYWSRCQGGSVDWDAYDAAYSAALQEFGYDEGQLLDLVASQSAQTESTGNGTSAPAPSVLDGDQTEALSMAKAAGIAAGVTPSTGFYGRAGELCVPCPEGGACFEDHDYLPVATPGWWLYLDPASSERGGIYCPEERAAFGPDYVCHVVLACEPQDACVGNNMCAGNYAGERCSECAENHYKLAGRCAECPQNPEIIVAVFVVGAILACSMGYYLNKRNLTLSTLMIAVDYMQVLAIFATSRIAFPNLLRDLFTILSAFNLNLEITAPECMVPSLSFGLKWAALMLLPVAALAILMVVHILLSLNKLLLMGRKLSESCCTHMDKLISVFTTGCFVLYLMLTQSVFSIFNCNPTDPAELNPDGSEKLYMDDVFEPCFEPGGLHLQLLPFAIVGFVVYTVGFPMFVSILLWRNYPRMQEDQLLRAYGLGDDMLTGPNTYVLRSSVGRLYYYFQINYIYWNLVIIARKFCIAVTALLFRRNVVFQLAVLLLVLICCYALHVRHLPYMAGQATKDDVVKQHRVMVEQQHDALHTLLANNISKVLRDQKRLEMHRNLWKRAQEGKPLGTLASEVAFDANTVEAVLLFSCILVCLAGIIFESEYLQRPGFEAQRDSAAILTMIIVITSLVYLAIVLFYEFSNALCPDVARNTFSCESAEEKAKREKSMRFTGEKAGKEQGDDIEAGAAQTNPIFFKKQMQAKLKAEQGGGAADESLHHDAVDIQQVLQAQTGEHGWPEALNWGVVQNLLRRQQETNDLLKQKARAAELRGNRRQSMMMGQMGGMPGMGQAATASPGAQGSFGRSSSARKRLAGSKRRKAQFDPKMGGQSGGAAGAGKAAKAGTKSASGRGRRAPRRSGAAAAAEGTSTANPMAAAVGGPGGSTDAAGAVASPSAASGDQASLLGGRGLGGRRMSSKQGLSLAQLQEVRDVAGDSTAAGADSKEAST